MENARQIVRFRQVKLTDGVPGCLYLHGMPGRHESLADAWAEAARLGVGTVVSLAPLDEIREKSPEYAKAIETGKVPCAIRRFPVCDFQGPDDDHAFQQLAVEIAESLRHGDTVLVHCGAGIGRTGMFAIAVLMALGLPIDDARRAVAAAGSNPERRTQEEALERIERLLRQRNHE